MSQSSLRKLLKNLPADQAQNIEAMLTSDKAKSIATSVLLLAGAVGMVGLALTAPNSIKMFSPLLRKKYGRPLRSNEQKEKLLQTFYYLKRSGQIRIQEKNDGLFAVLTEKGRKRFHTITSDVHVVQKPSVWPGTWWLVAADIPTKDYKIAADMLRLKLRELRFYPLQRTLWIHPFNPRAELEYIANKYHVSRFVTVMEIKRMDIQDEDIIKAHFTKAEIL
jgi:hypothetical protein